jgi:hypothetical protein
MAAATPKSWRKTHELHAQPVPTMLGRDAPHRLYANMKFDAPAAPDARKLLQWLEPLLPRWTESRILRYLQEHQEQFCECLEWVTNDCVVDFGGTVERESYEWIDFEKKWEQEPEVRFLRQHGFEHAGVTIKPYWGRDRTYPDYFSDMQLSQRKPRDPLDPILWDVIAHLSVYGRLFVRRCEYQGCRRFFSPKTSRKRFCRDSCRALDHVPVNVKDVAAFRKKKKKYMREYRQNPQVKKRLPKSHAQPSRGDG